MYVEARIGDRWAYRVGKKLGTPAIPVEILQFGPESSKHKVRVRYLGGEYSGLDEWVPKTRLIVPWESHGAWWEEEINQVEAVQLGEPESDDEYMAVMHVFSAYMGETVFNLEHKRQLWGLLEIHDEEGAVEALERADFALTDLPGFYRNRWGEPRASWPAALQVAKHLCRAFPSLIAEAIERDLRKSEWHTVHGHQIGKWYIEPESCKQYLEEERPIYDMVFSWCDVEVLDRLSRERALDDEVTRLRGLLTDIVRDYRLSGHPQLAARLEKKIRLEAPAG